MSSPNTTPIKNPTPREQFRESADNISKHRDLVDNPIFGRAIHYALLEYQVIATNTIRDGNSSMATGFKIQGALEFVGVLRLLAEQYSVPQKLAERNLDHTV